ncbi:hypothetical protein Taro_010749 [Colocasia esculenta]|uniref:Uncharacterized protein n=1 Tax=Colocasia esculenta TaxID=4460 RepID=A0A843UE16_COLES|nr:hypothetical protein [Colocasia esculenta]
MGRRNRPCCGSQGLAAAALQAIAFFLLAGVAVSASFISDHALGSGGWTGRSLLQAKQTLLVEMFLKKSMSGFGNATVVSAGFVSVTTETDTFWPKPTTMSVMLQ